MNIHIILQFQWKGLFFDYLNFIRLYGGELFDHIASLNEIVELDSRNYAKQILDALSYLHKRNIVHLDLKVSFYFYNLCFSQKILFLLINLK